MNREDRRAAAAAAAATTLGSLALLPVFTTSAWLRPVLSVVLVVWGGGVLLRSGGPALWQRVAPGRPVPRAVGLAGTVAVPITQLVLVLVVLTVFYAPADAWWRLLPTPASVTDLAGVFTDGSAELREQATPALPLTGLVALTALLVGLVAVAVDLIAVAGRQAALAGLGLLLLYCVPVSTISGSFGLTPVVAPAAGFGLLLWADQRRRLAAGDRPTARATTGSGSQAALRVGVLALLGGILLGAVLPTLPEGSFGTGLGGGSGPGGATGTALDPVAALQGQLTLPEPKELLRVESDVPDPGHLRAVVLDQYDADDGWTMSNLDGELSVTDPDLAPLPPAQDRRRVTARFIARGHDDRFLPVLWSPQSVAISDPDDWRYDPATGTVFGRETTTGQRSWFVEADQPVPDPALLQSAAPLDPADPVQQRFTALPELDPEVTAQVGKLIEGAQTPYQRVRRISDYLSDRSNGFVYSLSTAPGTSDDHLVNFLRLKRGYCEQYAGAMAVMVRAAGIPARVALGYTPGEVLGDGSRRVTTDDAHAWVEAYFSGLGWVPFDPTPISEERSVDLPWAPRGADDPAAAAEGSTATTAPQAQPTPRTDRAGEAVSAAQAPTAAQGWVRPLLVTTGAVLLVAALVAVPAGARVLQRRRRLAAGGARDLWDELVATVADLGLELDPAWTPRRSAASLADRAGHGRDPVLASRAADAVHRLALAEEAASYGPPAELGEEQGRRLREELNTARRGLEQAAPRRTRLLAALWPASLVTGTAAASVDRLRGLTARIGLPGRSRAV